MYDNFTQKMLQRKALSGWPESQSQSPALLEDEIHINKKVPILGRWSLETRLGTPVPAGKKKLDIQGENRLADPGRSSRARQGPFEFR